MNNTINVLAIDAAWTAQEPSAVALLQQSGQVWSCRALAPSYSQFLSLAEGRAVNWDEKPRGQFPDMDALLSASGILLGEDKVKLITVDMPMSNVPITGYRMAERRIASTFSKHGCAAHAPSSTRPGKISEIYTKDSYVHGFELGVDGTPSGTLNQLLEVYPHPALLKLMNTNYRLEYKAAKTSRYWPGLENSERKQKLHYIYTHILAELGQYITNIPSFLPAEFRQYPFSYLKRFEDAIDALVCGWVGVKYIEGKATSYGDETGAIWVPD